MGDQLGPLTMPLPAWRFVAYQGATWDFHRGHHDWEFAKSLGEPAPYADGQLFGALMARLVTRWGGRDCLVRTLSFRLRNMVRPGETVNVDGSVKEVEQLSGLVRVTIDLRVTLQQTGATPPGALVAEGEATVEVPRT